MVDPVFRVLQEMSTLDKFNVPMLPASEVSSGLVVREYVNANRPLLIQGYA